jgi:PAS domain S-box-containing protein
MNAEAMRLEQRPKEAILGKTHWEAHPNAAPELCELYRQAMRERRASSLEHRYVWPDGRDTWIDMRAYPVGDGLAVFYRDVTDRKRAEEAIRASDDRQRFLISLDDEVRGLASPVAVVTATSRALGERLAAARVAYAEIDEARDSATTHGGWTDGTVAHLPIELRLSDFGATMIKLLKAGQTVRVNDATDDPRMTDGIASLEAIGARALVSVPLVKDGCFVLSLNVHQSVPRAWTDAEVELIEAVAERTWGAVERARAEAALQESETRFRGMADDTPVMMWVTDPNGYCTYLNARWYEFTGQAPGYGEGYGWLDAVHPADRPAAEAAFVSANAERRNYRVDFRLRRADGMYRWVIDAAAARFSGDGEYLGYVGSVIDIDERREAEEHQRLLINELNHRVKNTLATVQSIASQTLRNAGTAEEARGALESRLMALSRVHDVLTRENWDGADMRAIVAEAIEPYSNPGEDRMHLSGERVRVPPRMALALAMALQELATNAVKYGALSNETGEVHIDWRDGDGRLHLIWRETGGPPVKAPRRRGFGTRLIERSLASDLDGEVRIDFEPMGLVCTVDAPLLTDAASF